MLNAFSCVAAFNPHSTSAMCLIFFNLFLMIQTLRFREIKQFLPKYMITNKWQSQDLQNSYFPDNAILSPQFFHL